MAVDKQYLEEAKQMLAGSLENQNIQLQNSFSQNMQGLEGQKAGVNQNFDKQLEQNAINTTNAQNQYLNNSLARGLGRSTIATSGAAGIKDSGNRIANNVNTDRTNALDNIEAQKVKLSEALQASLLGLSANFESQQLTLAQQLADSAYNRQWQEGQFSYQKEQDAIANAMAQAKFDYQKQQDALAYQLAQAKASGGAGSSRSSGSSGSGKKKVVAKPTNDSAINTAKAQNSAAYNNTISALKGQSLVPSSYAWNKSLIQAELMAAQQRRAGSGGGSYSAKG